MTTRGRATLGVMAVVLLLAGVVLVFGWKRGLWTARAPACDASSCAEANCRHGFHPEVGPDGCCRVCVATPRKPVALNPHNPDRCKDAKCAECSAGTKAHPEPGECCPTCVAVDDEACEKGLAQYDARRLELDEELRGCTADSDCMFASFGDACRSSCPMALNKLRIGTVTEKLREEATVYCERCFPSTFECPNLDAAAVHCSKGRCEIQAADGGARGGTSAEKSSPPRERVTAR